jgi:hypothetical protein
MASKRDAVVDLVEKLLGALETQRRLGGGSYPLPLDRLIALTDPQTPSALIEKAIAGKSFNDRVVVAQRKNRVAPVALAVDGDLLADSPLLLEFALQQVCSPETPIQPLSKLKSKVDPRLRKCFAEAVVKRIHDGGLPHAVGCRLEKKKPLLYLQRIPPPPPPPPPPKPEEVLGEELLQSLKTLRSSADYPPSLQLLVEKSRPQAKPALVRKALALPAVRDRLARADGRKWEAPLALVEDSGLLLEVLLRARRQPEENAFLLDRLLPKPSALTAPFRDAIFQQIAAGALSAKLGLLWVGKKRLVFLAEDVEHRRLETVGPVAPPRSPPSDSGPSFDDAFQELNQRRGGHNLVSLVDLRRTLPLAHDVFDGELRKLRLAGRYTLSAAEGRHGLSAEERDAAIAEDGALLLYVSRRSP